MKINTKTKHKHNQEKQNLGLPYLFNKTSVIQEEFLIYFTSENKSRMKVLKAEILNLDLLTLDLFFSSHFFILVQKFMHH